MGTNFKIGRLGLVILAIAFLFLGSCSNDDAADSELYDITMENQEIEQATP